MSALGHMTVQIECHLPPPVHNMTWKIQIWLKCSTKWCHRMFFRSWISSTYLLCQSSSVVQKPLLLGLQIEAEICPNIIEWFGSQFGNFLMLGQETFVDLRRPMDNLQNILVPKSKGVSGGMLGDLHLSIEDLQIALPWNARCELTALDGSSKDSTL